MEQLSEFVRSFWVVWLMLIFLGIVAWAYWPSRRRKKQMRDYANIPFRDEQSPGPGSAGEREADKGDRRPD